jgi:DNA-binding response OmpR family regulator
MTSNECRVDDLIVVDASIEDYEALLNDEAFQDLAHRHFTTGEAALRGVDLSQSSLWMVNMRLPDMEGVGLLGLVRNRTRRCPVFLISDGYSLAEEIAARAAGASAYLCKPVDSAWLRLCHHAISRTAIRKGIPHTLG